MGVARTPLRCGSGETRDAQSNLDRKAELHSSDNITVEGKTGREMSENRELLEHEDVNDLINVPLKSGGSGLLSNEKST